MKCVDHVINEINVKTTQNRIFINDLSIKIMRGIHPIELILPGAKAPDTETIANSWVWTFVTTPRIGGVSGVDTDEPPDK